MPRVITTAIYIIYMLTYNWGEVPIRTRRFCCFGLGLHNSSLAYFIINTSLAGRCLYQLYFVFVFVGGEGALRQLAANGWVIVASTIVPVLFPIPTRVPTPTALLSSRRWKLFKHKQSLSSLVRIHSLWPRTLDSSCWDQGGAFVNLHA